MLSSIYVRLSASLVDRSHVTCRGSTMLIAAAVLLSPGKLCSPSVATAFDPKGTHVGKKLHLTPSSRFHTSAHAAKAMSSSDEIVKAKAATADNGKPTVFDKILSGEWSSDKVHEDDIALAFRDITPQAPVHILVIPKKRDGLTQLSNMRDDQKSLLGHLMFVAQMVGKKECPDGFRIVVNDGVEGAQSVYHLHIHVLGGKQMGWPPG